MTKTDDKEINKDNEDKLHPLAPHPIPRPHLSRNIPFPHRGCKPLGGS